PRASALAEASFRPHPRRNSMRRVLAWSCALLISAAGSVSAQETQLLFVENSRGGDVSVIDDATLKVIGTIDIGLSPDDIVTSPDSKTLYLTRIVRRPQNR